MIDEIKKQVTEQEFYEFIRNYPRPLERDVCGAFEPPLITYNDIALGRWPDGTVADTYRYDDDLDGYYYTPHEERVYTIVVNHEELYKEKMRCKNNGVD